MYDDDICHLILYAVLLRVNSMIHEQSSQNISDFIAFIGVVGFFIWILGIALGNVDIVTPIKKMDSFEIARSVPMFDVNDSDTFCMVEEPVTKPKKKQAKKPVHPLYQDCVLALRGVGVSSSEARKAARDYLKSNPDIDSVEKFLAGIFRKNK